MATGAQIAGGIEQRRIVFFQIGVQRQHHKGQVDIHQAGDNGGAAEHQVDGGQADAFQQGVKGDSEGTLGAENNHPGVDAHQKVAPERQNHQQQEQVAVFLGTAGDGQCQGVGHHGADGGGQQGKAQRLDQQAEVNGGLKQSRPIFGGEVKTQRAIVQVIPGRETAIVAGIPERSQQHHERRQCEKQQQIGRRGQRQQGAPQLGRKVLHASAPGVRRRNASTVQRYHWAQTGGCGRERCWPAAPQYAHRQLQ